MRAECLCALRATRDRCCRRDETTRPVDASGPAHVPSVSSAGGTTVECAVFVGASCTGIVVTCGACGSELAESKYRLPYRRRIEFFFFWGGEVTS